MMMTSALLISGEDLSVQFGSRDKNLRRSGQREKRRTERCPAGEKALKRDAYIKGTEDQRNRGARD